MKKIFIAIITLMFFIGCTSQKEINNNDKTKPDETNKNILSYNQVTSKDLIYYSLEEYNELTLTIIERFGVEPHWITITPDYSQIGWGSDIGSSNSKEDHEFKKYTSDDRLFASLYFGELTQLSENVYRVKGDVIPSQKDEQTSISDTVDYYLVFDEDRLYLVFEEINLAELNNYKSDTYFTKIVNNHEESLYTPESTQSPGISPTPKPTKNPENVPTNTLHPTKEPDDTHAPVVTIEPTADTNSDLDESYNYEYYPEYTDDEKEKFSNYYLSVCQNFNSNLKITNFGDNNLFKPSLRSYRGKPEDYFILYDSSNPGVSIHVSYYSASDLYITDDVYAYLESNYLEINRMMHGADLYSEIKEILQSINTNQSNFYMNLSIKNPSAHRILYNDNQEEYMNSITHTRPLHVTVYTLFDGQNDLDSFNKAAIEELKEYFGSLPVSLILRTAYTDNFSSFSDYILEESFSDQQVEFSDRIIQSEYRNN